MDPELIKQLRQALRAAGLNIKDDVRAYASSIGIATQRVAKVPTTTPRTAPAPAPTQAPVSGADVAPIRAEPAARAPVAQASSAQPSADLENRKEQLISQVSTVMSNSDLAPYQEPIVNKIKAVTDREALNQIDRGSKALLGKYQQAQKVGPEAAKAFADVVGSTEGIKKAEQQPAPAAAAPAAQTSTTQSPAAASTPAGMATTPKSELWYYYPVFIPTDEQVPEYLKLLNKPAKQNTKLNELTDDQIIDTMLHHLHQGGPRPELGKIPGMYVPDVFQSLIMKSIPVKRADDIVRKMFGSTYQEWKQSLQRQLDSENNAGSGAPASSPGQLSEGQFVSLANKALSTKDYSGLPQGLVFYDKTFTLAGVVFKEPVKDFRKALVIGLPSVRTDLEMLALGYGAKRIQGLLVSDAGRPAHERFNDTFEIRDGNSISTIKPALRDSKTKEVIQKGIIELPL